MKAIPTDKLQLVRIEPVERDTRHGIFLQRHL